MKNIVLILAFNLYYLKFFLRPVLGKGCKITVEFAGIIEYKFRCDFQKNHQVTTATAPYRHYFKFVIGK